MEWVYALVHLFVTVFLCNFSAFMVLPAISDVTMAALCPGKDECSSAIYLTGFQQAITGVGTLVATPLIGNLSDEYGRKTLLTLPMSLAIVPLVIMAYDRTTYYFYVYTVIRTLTDMVCEGTVHCLALAYVADEVPHNRRASAFGLLSGVASAGFVCGTLTARFLSIPSAFQAAAAFAVLAVVYMKTFLKESSRSFSDSSNPIGKIPKGSFSDGQTVRRKESFSRIPSVDDMTCLLKSSLTFSQSAIVAFFNGVGESGLSACLLYYLKAKFHFNKNQFADLLLIAGIAGTTSQLLVMPLLASIFGEVTLLTVGLCASWLHIFLYGLAWSFWVPYVASMFSIMVVFSPPCIRSIVSKQVGPDEQGKAQGCISGIGSIAKIMSPLVFTPLTALFLSEHAPFHFPGLSIMCTGIASVIAFIQSLMIRAAPPISTSKVADTGYLHA
ncbi:hypothetical protein H6P81_018724 [Aristolochia fimbriata]|uniref:Major facilitator superfamily (MFS) profile domain-containing protein n=1 Tax=Aristolochia fimbriata TaxID=158543 RepID=A0AAV7E418_ARIFI|nr:hypothetical protein H6P81_018724 [Aristolochia fimbriata]